MTQKRVELVKQFYKYKSSLRFSGEIKKDVLNFYDSDKAKYFFAGYYHILEEIISKIGANPCLLARMLANDGNKKFDNSDFVQSILYHLYPCHIPPMINNSYETSHCLQFVEQIIN